MNIGFDIDGTFTDFYAFVAKKGQAFLQKQGMDPVLNKQGYDLDEYYCLKEYGLAQHSNEDAASRFSEGLLKQFWDKHYLAYLRQPFIPGVVKAARALKQAGHRIHIISSRKGATLPSLKGRFIKHSIAWQLRHNGIAYDQLSLSEDDDKKLETIAAAGLDLFVEDKPHLIRALPAHCHCVAMAQPYNQPLTAQTGLTICEQPEKLLALVEAALKSALKTAEKAAG